MSFFLTIELFAAHVINKLLATTYLRQTQLY